MIFILQGPTFIAAMLAVSAGSHFWLALTGGGEASW